jgi:hypothetical protein
LASCDRPRTFSLTKQCTISSMKKQILYIKVSQFDEIFYLLVTGPGVLSNELSCSATFCLSGVLPSPLLEPGGLPTGPFCNTPCFC